MRVISLIMYVNMVATPWGGSIVTRPCEGTTKCGIEPMQTLFNRHTNNRLNRLGWGGGVGGGGGGGGGRSGRHDVSDLFTDEGHTTLQDNPHDVTS